jgi:hypothetical protein
MKLLMHPIVYYLELIIWAVFCVYVLFLDPFAYKRAIIRIKGIRLSLFQLYALFLVNGNNPIVKLLFVLFPQFASLLILKTIIHHKSLIKDIQNT